VAARLERGFGLLLYGLVALGILGALGGMAYSVRKAGYDAATAELQPKIDAAHNEIRKQNEAIAAWKADADRRAKEAASALKAASARASTWEANASRLRAVLTAKRPPDKPAPTDCREAWAEIRGPAK